MRAILSGSIITTEDERNVNNKNCYVEKIYFVLLNLSHSCFI